MSNPFEIYEVNLHDLMALYFKIDYEKAYFDMEVYVSSKAQEPAEGLELIEQFLSLVASHVWTISDKSHTQLETIFQNAIDNRIPLSRNGAIQLYLAEFDNPDLDAFEIRRIPQEGCES